MKPKLVYLEWSDAIGNTRWFTRDDAVEWAKTSQWFIREVGWIIHEDAESITFASSWKVADDYTVEQFSQLHKIPKPWIRKRKALKLPT